MKAALRLKLELGVRSQESGGKSQKEEGKSQKAGARISVFTNMRCSLDRRVYIWNYQRRNYGVDSIAIASKLMPSWP
ncbi:hypothetical protein QUA82_04910 [Microcoleus sp. F8-D3]